MSTLIERQLRASVALPFLIAAVKLTLPILREEHDHLSSAVAHAKMRGREQWIVDALQAQADKMLHALMATECALKTAEPPLVRVVQEPGLQLVQR